MIVTIYLKNDNGIATIVSNLENKKGDRHTIHGDVKNNFDVKDVVTNLQSVVDDLRQHFELNKKKKGS